MVSLQASLRRFLTRIINICNVLSQVALYNPDASVYDLPSPRAELQIDISLGKCRKLFLGSIASALSKPSSFY